MVYTYIVTSYIGLVYWERKEDEYLVGLVAAAATAKKFKSLVEVKNA